MTGQNFVGSSYSAEGSKSFRSSNPKTGEFSPTVFIQASPEEVNNAVELASTAFFDYAFLSPKQRASFLERIAREMEDAQSEIISAFCFESGLPIKRAKDELQRTLFQLQSFASALSRGDYFSLHDNVGEANFVTNPPRLQKRMQGIGPVVVFGASNFPLAYSTAGGDTASALAAGCPVIVKAHPLHAGTSELVAQCVISAGQKTNMPNGVFSHLQAIDFSVGEQLVLHPKVKAVGFTGSLPGGRALMDFAASRKQPIPVFAEMGSVNPIVLLQEAIEGKNELADLLATSVCNAAGQFCTKPGLIFAPETQDLDEFISLLGNAICSKESCVMLHESIVEKFQKRRKEVLMSKHLSLFEVSDKKRNEGQNTMVVVTMQQFIEQAALRDEVFGPFTLLIRYKGEEELLKGLDQIDGSLTASIFSGSSKLSTEHPWVRLLSTKAGRIILNGVPTGVTVSQAMTHGGPYPAASDARFSAVGVDSIYRWLRPVTLQSFD